MKKLLTIIALTLTGLLLVACEDKKPLEPILPEDSTPLVPLEPSTPIEKPEEPGNELPVEEGEFKLYGADFEKGVFQTATINTSNMTEITITIIAESIYDVPVNLNNFKVDGESVSYDGVSGTSYLVDHDFTIGALSAKGRMINTHKFNDLQDLRLHTLHATHGTEHYITVNVADADSFAFDFGVTTKAFDFIKNIKINFNYTK